MAVFDAHKNLALSAIATPPAPPSSGVTITVTTGEGSRFPAVPFNATVWPAGATPLPSNAEIVRVTAKAADTFTIVRAQEGSVPRAIVVGDVIAATITAKTITDVESAVNALGVWQAHPFNAADYTGSGGLVWTVAAENVPVNRYAVIGKTLHWTVRLTGSVLSGTPAGTVSLRIPGGFNGGVADWGILCRLLIGGAGVLGNPATIAGANYINVGRHDSVALAVGDFWVLFSIAFEIQ